MIKKYSVLISIVLSLQSCAHIQNRTPASGSGSDSAQTKRIPWSGSFWPMIDAELALGWDDEQGRRSWTKKEVLDFDACLFEETATCETKIKKQAGTQGEKLPPLLKYDLWMKKNAPKYFPGGVPYTAYSHAAKRELEIHYIDNEKHRYWESRHYAGKCIGWALANFDFDEPTQEKVIDGILFKPADIKGILTAIYNGAQFFIPDEEVIGTEYHDQSDDSQKAYDDVLPHDFVRSLALTIKKNKMLEADLDPADAVWNYPIYKYDLSWKLKSPTVASVEATIYYADDQVGPDEVFSTKPRRDDILSRNYTFELTVPRGWNGDLLEAQSGQWTGESVDNHPDVVIMGIEDGWRTTVYEYQNSKMNMEMNMQLIKRVKNEKNKWIPAVDLLLKRYYAK